MASVNFYLDGKELDNGERQIFLNFRFHGQRYRLYTGKKIDPGKWDQDKGRASSRKFKNNPIGFNAFLQGLSDEIEKLTNENKPISVADVKAIIESANGKRSEDTFFGFCEGYLNQQIEKGHMKSLSSKPFTGTLNHLKKLRPSLSFTEVDLNFYDRFVSYLRGKDISSNSIGGHIKRLKWFMAAGLDRDLHGNVSFKKKAFKATREETDQIYLTKTEINKLAKKSLPERLKKVADTFVLNCHLGIRFSDLSQIQKENFKQENGLYHLHMVQGKTSEKVVIPVPQNALTLLKKYKFACPAVSSKGKLMSVQKFNDYLKEAAKKAEIDSMVDIRENGSVKKYSKHELIVSHTARRSFATNLYLDEVPVQNIMAVTGHKKEQTFFLYIRADQLTKAQGLARHYRKTSKTEMKVSRGGKAAY